MGLPILFPALFLFFSAVILSENKLSNRAFLKFLQELTFTNMGLYLISFLDFISRGFYNLVFSFFFLDCVKIYGNSA